MKQLFFLVLFLSSCVLSFAQGAGSVKIFGFKEPVVQGKAPKQTTEENGDAKTAYNYFIYLSSAAKVYPSEIWIDGEPYAVLTETVSQTPVERKNYNNPSEPKTTVLVPKTSEKVMMLTPAPPVQEKLTAKAKGLAATNELVVVYKLNGVFYYDTMKQLTELEAVNRQ